MFLLPPEFYQIKNVPKKGRGAFARREIPAGTIIGDYLGRIVKDEKLEYLEKKHGNACYAMDYEDDKALSIFPVDIKAAGIHLINHSCAPNCDAYYYFGRTLYFSLRRIFPGEELTVDYGFDPGDKNEKGLIYPCFCSSPFCRGTMFTNAQRLLQYSLYYHQESKRQKFISQKAGSILLPLKKYPALIKDNQIFNLYGSQDYKSLACDDKEIPTLKELRKRLREEGRILNFKKLGIKVVAIVDGNIVAER